MEPLIVIAIFAGGILVGMSEERYSKKGKVYKGGSVSPKPPTQRPVGPPPPPGTN